MIEAWMKRDAERQKLLDAMKQVLLDEEAKAHRRMPLQIDMCRAMLEHFAEGAPSVPFVETSARQFFRTQVLPAIEEFARTPEEALALVADLFLWLCQSITRYSRVPLEVQEECEPERIFAGHKAMDKVG